MAKSQKRKNSGQHDDHRERRPPPPPAGTSGTTSTPKPVSPPPNIGPASIGVFDASSKQGIWTDVGNGFGVSGSVKEVERRFAAQPAGTSEGDTSVPSSSTSPPFPIPSSRSPRKPKPTTGAYSFAIGESAVAEIDDESTIPEKVKQVERDLADINHELGCRSIETDDVDTAREAIGKTTKSIAVMQEAQRKYREKKITIVSFSKVRRDAYSRLGVHEGPADIRVNIDDMKANVEKRFGELDGFQREAYERWQDQFEPDHLPVMVEAINDIVVDKPEAHARTLIEVFVLKIIRLLRAVNVPLVVWPELTIATLDEPVHVEHKNYVTILTGTGDYGIFSQQPVAQGKGKAKVDQSLKSKTLGSPGSALTKETENLFKKFS